MKNKIAAYIIMAALAASMAEGTGLGNSVANGGNNVGTSLTDAVSSTHHSDVKAGETTTNYVEQFAWKKDENESENTIKEKSVS